MKTAGFFVVSAVALSVLSNCSSNTYITPVSRPGSDAILQITDEGIREELEAQPQMMKPVNVAVYKTGFVDHAFVDSLVAIPEIANVFELNPWLMEAEKHQEPRPDPWYGSARAPRDTDLKSLRRLAAQGRADILVFCGISHELNSKANWRAWSYLAVVPALFVRGVDVELRTRCDLVFVDVRNGFLYGTHHGDTRVELKRKSLLGYKGEARKEVEKQAGILLPGMIEAMRMLATNDQLFVATEEQSP